MEVIKSYSFYLNTKQCNTGGNNDATWIFTNPVTLSNVNNRFTIACNMAEIPYSFSQLNAYNNVLNYSWSEAAGSFNSSITFPTGNYNVNTLISELILLLITDVYFRLPATTINANQFYITYNPSTSKITFFLSYAATCILKFSTNQLLGFMFGFPQTDQTFSNAIKLQAPNKVQTNPITSIYLRSQNLKFQASYEAIVSTFKNSNIVAKIPVTTQPNSMLYYRNDLKQVLTNIELNEINLFLSDNINSNNVLDMQGLNWGILITIDEVQFNIKSESDKVPLGKIEMPQELLESRDNIINTLIERKKQLEDDINNKKKEKENENKISS
jgi:hypothetical protein